MWRRHGKFLMAVAITLKLPTGAGVNGQASEQARTQIASGLAFRANLESTLDSKKIKTGEPVAARTTEALKVDGKTILPNGTKLIGHVVASQARANGDSDSLLAIQFDKAVLKDKEELPIAVVIRAIAPPRRKVTGDSVGQDPLAGTHAGTMTSPMGTGRTDSTMERVTANRGEAEDANSELGADGNLTPASRGVYGIKGLRLAADSSKMPPVVIFNSAEKSVRVESETRLLLFTQAAESAGSNP